MGIAAAFGVVMLALFALTWNLPTMTSWVSDAARAKFARTMTPEQAPLQTTQPARPIRTVKAE